MRLRSIVAVMALAAGLGVASLHGQPQTEITYVTFNTPVELPGGTVLQPGEYTFRLSDSMVNRHIVEVFSGRDQNHITTLLAVPAMRRETPDETIVTFKETKADQPAPIQYWFYTGDRTGQEFVYPREQGTRIAQATHQPVLVTDTIGNDADNLRTGKISRVGPEGETAYNDTDSTQSGQTAQANQSDQMSAQSAQSSQSGQTARAGEGGSLSPRPALSGERGGTTQPSQVTGTSGQGTTASPTSSATARSSTPGSTTGHGMTTASGQTISQSRTGNNGTSGSTNTSDNSTSQSAGNSGRSSRRGRLPQTASDEPLIAFFGLFALVGAAAIRFGLR